MIWNEARECMSRDELASLHGRRLVKLVEYMYRNAAYYRKKMQKLGIEPGDIQGIEDLKKLPFTTKEDLAGAYPLGVFAMAGSKIVRYYASNHRNGHYAGMETIAGYTRNDIEVSKECMARSISMADLGERDVIQVAYNCGTGIEGISAQYGAEQVGAAVVPMVSDDEPEELIALMRRLCVTGVVSPVSQLDRLAKTAEESSLRHRLKLKAAICGGVSWNESFRDNLQARLGIKVYDIFGLNELTGQGVACECECQKGLHIQEDFFLAEIVDRNSLLVRPDGLRGELVFTTLQKEGIPLIRYCTRHFTRIYYEKCECGRTMARIDRVCSTDEMLLIRGKSVPVFRIEEALSGMEDIDASYVIYIRKEHAFDVVDIYIEWSKVNEELLSEGGSGLKRRVADAVSPIIGIMPIVQFKNSTADSPSVTDGKKVTIRDKR